MVHVTPESMTCSAWNEWKTSHNNVGSVVDFIIVITHGKHRGRPFSF